MHAYLLLDRSGSMGQRWDDALGAVNAYVTELGAAPAADDHVTLAVFDHSASFQFDVLRRNIHPTAWEKVTSREVTPRGGTPLLDAVGRIVAMAEDEAPEKAVFAIITDGKENQSQEMNRASAKAALERCAARGWQVVFLGADFKEFTDAHDIGLSASKAMGFKAQKGEGVFATLASKSAAYRNSGANIDFNAADRQEADEDKI